MSNRYEFSRSGSPVIQSPTLQGPTEYEQEERNIVSLESYVINVGNSISRDLTLGLSSVGASLALIQIANNPTESFSYLMGASYVCALWGISKVSAANTKDNLVKSFNENHSVRSKNWSFFSGDSSEDPEDELRRFQPYLLTIRGASGSSNSYNVGELIPEGWTFKEFKSACQSVKNSGNFSEPGSNLHKDKFSQLRESFFEYSHENNTPLLIWKDPENHKRGVRMVGHCKALIAEIPKIKSVKLA